MNACNFETLLRLFDVNMKINPEMQLKIFDHLSRCDMCRDAVHQLSLELNGDRKYCMKPETPRDQADMT